MTSTVNLLYDDLFIRLRRDVISLESVTIVPQTTCPLPVDNQCSIYSAPFIFSVLVNILFVLLILKVPLYRGVIMHVLRTSLRNIVSIMLRQTGNDERIQNVEMTTIERVSRGEESSHEESIPRFASDNQSVILQIEPLVESPEPLGISVDDGFSQPLVSTGMDTSTENTTTQCTGNVGYYGV